MGDPLFRIGFAAVDRYTPRVSQQLNGRQRGFLRALAHHLEPVVQIGRSGATPAVLAQIGDQLLAHELIKVRFGKEAPEGAAEACDAIATATKSLVVQTAGRVLSLYRRHDTKPKIKLPNSGQEGQEASDAEAKPKRDPKKSLNKLHAAKRARNASSGSEETSVEPKRRGENARAETATEKPAKRSVLSRLRAPRAGTATRRASVTSRNRSR